jgi:hypothetical protein
LRTAAGGGEEFDRPSDRDPIEKKWSGEESTPPGRGGGELAWRILL